MYTDEKSSTQTNHIYDAHLHLNFILHLTCAYPDSVKIKENANYHDFSVENLCQIVYRIYLLQWS